MNHELIREISQKDRRALCLVVAVVKTTKEVKMTATLNVAVDADTKVWLYEHPASCSVFYQLRHV